MIGKIGKWEIALMLKELKENGIEVCPIDHAEMMKGGHSSASVDFKYDTVDDKITKIYDVKLVYDKLLEECDVVFRNTILHEINHAWMVPKKVHYKFSDFLGNSWCMGEINRVVEMYRIDTMRDELLSATFSIARIENFENWICLEHERCAIFFMMSLCYPEKVREVAPVTFTGVMDSIDNGMFGNVIRGILNDQN